MRNAITRARSFLFVPASRHERFAKALASAAGCIIIDLEDAVAPQDKASARDALANALALFTRDQLARTMVRINAGASAWHDDDLRMLASLGTHAPAGVMVPKAEIVSCVTTVADAPGPDVQLVPLVESLEGLDGANLLARSPQVARLAFGHLDFQLDVGMRCSPDEAELAPVRLELVMATRRARLAAPIDGVTTDARNTGRTRDDAMRARVRFWRQVMYPS